MGSRFWCALAGETIAGNMGWNQRLGADFLYSYGLAAKLYQRGWFCFALRIFLPRPEFCPTSRTECVLDHRPKTSGAASVIRRLGRAQSRVTLNAVGQAVT